MENLEEKEWAVFDFSDVFIIRKGFYNKKPNDNGSGTIPFLGAVDSNNGITRFLTLDEIEMSTRTGAEPNEPLDRKLFPGHAIAVTNDGSVGHAYYQETFFTCSHSVNPLYLKDHEMNQYEAEFLIKAIEKQGELFQYARKWRPIRMVKSKILLPVTDVGEPDYEYMIEYVQQQEENLLSKYLGYVTKRLSDLGDIIQIPELNEMEWGSFRLTDIFPEIERGKRLKSADHIEGSIPYISSSGDNNGIANFISNECGVRKFSNCISFANSGSVGSAFYEPFIFIASDHITHLKNNDFNQYIYMFISTMMSKIAEKYNFNREINDYRISRERVLLPMTDTGVPDYEYMEQYVKNMMISKYHQYLDYTEKR